MSLSTGPTLPILFNRVIGTGRASFRWGSNSFPFANSSVTLTSSKLAMRTVVHFSDRIDLFKADGCNRAVAYAGTGISAGFSQVGNSFQYCLCSFLRRQLTGWAFHQIDEMGQAF